MIVLEGDRTRRSLYAGQLGSEINLGLTRKAKRPVMALDGSSLVKGSQDFSFLPSRTTSSGNPI